MEKLNKQSFHNIQTIFAERTGINVCEKRYKKTDEVKRVGVMVSMVLGSVSIMSLTAFAFSRLELSWKDIFGEEQTVIGGSDEVTIPLENIIEEAQVEGNLQINIQKVISDERALYILYTVRGKEGQFLDPNGRFADFQMYFPNKMMSGAFYQMPLKSTVQYNVNELGGVIYADWQADTEEQGLILQFSDWQEKEMSDSVKVDFNLEEAVRNAGENVRMPVHSSQWVQEYLWQPAGGQTELPYSNGVFLDNVGWGDDILQFVLRGPVDAWEWFCGQNFYLIDTRTDIIIYPASLGVGCTPDELDNTIGEEDWQYFWRYFEVEEEDLPFLELYCGGKEAYVTKVKGDYKVIIDEIPVTMSSERLVENIVLEYNGTPERIEKIECSKITIGIYFAECIDSLAGILQMFEAYDVEGNILDYHWAYTADANGEGSLVWTVFDEPQEQGTINTITYNGEVIYSAN